MSTFTPTEFRANSSKVFNEVQSKGKVLIKSKNRPSMVLMMESEFKKHIKASASKAKVEA